MGRLFDAFRGVAPDDFTDPAAFQLAQVSFDAQLQAYMANHGQELEDSVAAVYRAKALIADTLGSVPVKVSDTQLAPAPNDTQTMQEFVVETAHAMMHREAYWRVSGNGSVRNLKPSRMSVTWTDNGDSRVYTYDNRRVYPGVNLRVLPLNRGPEDTTGTGPLLSPRISGLIALNQYIDNYYRSNADRPGGRLTAPRELTAEEADQLLALWYQQVERSRGVTVLSGGLTYENDGFSPQESEYSQGALLGVQDVAILFGVPGPLIESNLGTSTTYQNRADLTEQFWKQTLFPSYASRIEAHLSEVYGQRVFFDPESYFMASLQVRAQATRTLVDAGYEPDDVADATGMPPMRHTGLAPVQVQLPEETTPDV